MRKTCKLQPGLCQSPSKSDQEPPHKSKVELSRPSCSVLCSATFTSPKWVSLSNFNTTFIRTEWLDQRNGLQRQVTPWDVYGRRGIPFPLVAFVQPLGTVLHVTLRHLNDDHKNMDTNATLIYDLEEHRFIYGCQLPSILLFFFLLPNFFNSVFSFYLLPSKFIYLSANPCWYKIWNQLSTLWNLELI
jgi:hypothetical protein